MHTVSVLRIVTYLKKLEMVKYQKPVLPIATWQIVVVTVIVVAATLTIKNKENESTKNLATPFQNRQNMFK